MSRATEITLFLILLQGSVGFIDGLGVFNAHYLEVPANNASFTKTDLEDYAHAAEHPPDLISELDTFVHWAWDAFMIGLKIIFTIVFVYDTLVRVFHVPEILSAFLQIGVYFVYAAWYSQYKSGKPWGLYKEV